MKDTASIAKVHLSCNLLTSCVCLHCFPYRTTIDGLDQLQDITTRLASNMADVYSRYFPVTQIRILFDRDVLLDFQISRIQSMAPNSHPVTCIFLCHYLSIIN